MSHLVFLLMNILSSCQFDNSSSLLEITKIALELHLLVRVSICFNSVLKHSLETFYTWTRLSQNVTNIWLNTPSVLKIPKFSNFVLIAVQEFSLLSILRASGINILSQIILTKCMHFMALPFPSIHLVFNISWTCKFCPRQLVFLS